MRWKASSSTCSHCQSNGDRWQWTETSETVSQDTSFFFKLFQVFVIPIRTWLTQTINGKMTLLLYLIPSNLFSDYSVLVVFIPV
jgi:hypothetical protein